MNDLYGHATGDRLLAEVGERLTDLAGPTVSAARLGGDEFGLILSGNPDHAAIRDFGASVCRRLRSPYLEGAISAEVSGSAGIVSYPEAGDSAALLFERADYALWLRLTPSVRAASFTLTTRSGSAMNDTVTPAMRQIHQIQGL